MTAQLLRSIYLTIAIILYGCALSHARGSETTDLRLMNSIATKTLFKEGEQALGRGDDEDALKIFSVICSRDNGASLRKLFCKAYIRRGELLYAHENYNEAMQDFLQARTIAEQYSFTELLPEIYHRIGNIFLYIEDNETGIMFYRKALGLSVKPGNDAEKQALYNNLLYVYYIKGEADSVKHYYDLYRNISTPTDRTAKYNLMISRGLVCEMNGDNSTAIDIYRKATAFARDSLDRTEYQGAPYSLMAGVYERCNMPDSAIHYLLINERLARATSCNTLLIESLRDLARIYNSLGNREKALEYKSDYLSLADSLLSRETLTLIKNSAALYEENRNADRIHSLYSANLQQRDWISGLFVAIAIIAIFCIIVWRQKQKLSKAWKDLYERNMQLLESENRYTSKIQWLERQLAELQPDAPAQITGDAALSKRILMSREQSQSLLEKISRIMEDSDCYCQPDFNLARLAAMAESNARYVSEVINDEYEMNFRAFLNKYRVKEAMRRLDDIENYGNFTIKAIGESVGYKSQTTFVTAFTKETGLKPSLYQQLARKRHAED